MNYVFEQISSRTCHNRVSNPYVAFYSSLFVLTMFVDRVIPRLSHSWLNMV